MLEVKNLNISYGGIHAVRGIDFEIADGKIVTLIGANGAGKSSTLRAVSGLLKKATGSIKYNGTEILGAQANKIVKMGIIHTPEGRRVFSEFTVEENLLMGAYIRDDKAEVAEDIKRIYQTFPRLEERRKQRASSLSGGEQQMLVVGRSLMGKPSLLMLDEPSLGLAPLICAEIFKIIRKINEEGTTILLVEQNAQMALKLCDYAYVLETGKILFEGKGEELLNDERVKAAYLGE